MFDISFNKKLIGLGLAIIVILALGGYWFVSQPSGEEVKVSREGSTRSALKLNLDYLQPEKIKEFKLYGRYPIEKGNPGRDNPFLPY